MKKESNSMELAIHGIFLLLGLITVGCVLLITVYLVLSGSRPSGKLALGTSFLEKPGPPPLPSPAMAFCPSSLPASTALRGPSFWVSP